MISTKTEREKTYPAGVNSFAFSYGQHDLEWRVCQIPTDFSLLQGFLFRLPIAVFPIATPFQWAQEEFCITATEHNWDPRVSFVPWTLAASITWTAKHRTHASKVADADSWP